MNTAPRGNVANLNPKRTKLCNQCSLVGTLKGTTPRHCPSGYAAFGRILKRTTPRHRPSRDAAFGRIFRWTAPRHRPSRDAAFGRILKRKTPRHRPSRYSAFGRIFKRTTPRHRPSGPLPFFFMTLACALLSLLYVGTRSYVLRHTAIR